MAPGSHRLPGERHQSFDPWPDDRASWKKAGNENDASCKIEQQNVYKSKTLIIQEVFDSICMPRPPPFLSHGLHDRAPNEDVRQV